MRIGVEVGGTFTDLVAIGEGGVRVLKVPSTPQNPDEGAFAAIQATGIPPSQIADLAHGSTVATNAVLERKGFLTAFITTTGFRDILSLQRHGRRRVYDLQYQKPVPVVTRRASFEIDERILADGSILRALDVSQVKTRLIPQLLQGEYKAIAICLLNSYVNPAHERQLRGLLHEYLPGVNIAISSDITREFREYERASTTTLSAYVQPVMDRYIARFSKRLREAGFSGRFSVMQSNGGRLPAEAMGTSAITALLSGPAAGVMGATRQAARSGCTKLITLDMGGTSSDVCVVVDGAPRLVNEFSLDGLPVRIPQLDINTVGAGGGSIIWVDDGGMLRVGPESAGASPGPACYCRGGTQPTITDAHIVRGTIQPEAFLGGRMKIDPNLARRALEPIAQHFGISVEEAADHAIEVGTASIVRAIQVISTERGIDPRDSVLVPYGGAGPLHAAQVASELGIRKVLVPPNSGVISAYGLLASDFIQYETLTQRGLVTDGAPDAIRNIYHDMRERALNRAGAMQLGESVELSFVVDMRFVGQAFEVSIPLTEKEVEIATVDQLRERFGAMHQKLYFFGADTSKPIEYISFRLGLTIPLQQIPILQEPAERSISSRTIRLYGERRWNDAHLMGRGALRRDQPLVGPALLEDPTSTLFVPQGWQAIRDANDNVILTAIEATP